MSHKRPIDSSSGTSRGRKIEGFEDLDVWVRCRELANFICEICEDGKLDRNRALQHQMLRASVSVVSNLGEGFNRRPVRERIQFFNVARGSVGELRAQSYLAADRKYVTIADSAKLMDLTTHCGRLLGGLLRYMDTVVGATKSFTSYSQGRSGRVSEIRASFEETEDEVSVDFDIEGYLAFLASEESN